jgi:hypothetical protein
MRPPATRLNWTDVVSGMVPALTLHDWVKNVDTHSPCCILYWLRHHALAAGYTVFVISTRSGESKIYNEWKAVLAHHLQQRGFRPTRRVSLQVPALELELLAARANQMAQTYTLQALRSVGSLRASTQGAWCSLALIVRCHEETKHESRRLVGHNL